MTPLEAASVRDLRARLRLSEERIASLEREREAVAGRIARRIAYLERDKQMALDRARKATDQGRYWHGLALVRRAP